MPSSVIRHFHYRPQEERLEVQFQSGRRYSYLGVPNEEFLAMKQASSKGEYLNAHIRDRYRYRREA